MNDAIKDIERNALQHYKKNMRSIPDGIPD